MTGENMASAEVRRTSLCKCGQKAEFIKDYFLTETKTLKEGNDDQQVKRDVENACGILRRRYCKSCISKVAAQQKRVNRCLNVRIFFSVFFPLALFSALAGVSYFILEDKSAIITMVTFAALAVIVSGAVLVLLSIAQNKRGRIAKGDYSNLKDVDALLDSLNFGLEDFKKVKELKSIDVLVDGDGRVNYDMERSGYAMRIIYEGKITLEPMRQRIIYPFKEDAEYIKRTYTHAKLLDDNIKTFDERELTDDDFDIRNGELRRYSGLSVNVVIPESVTKICVQAFRKSKNCETLTVPDTVTEIEKEAFAHCPATRIVLPAGLKKIASFCFYGSAITDIQIPDTVEEIGDNAFGECYNLERIVIPAACKKIGEAAFKNCTILSEVEINEGLESISDYAFNGCRALEKIDIPDGCYELGNFSFEGCTQLKEVYLPETIQFVGGRVFEGAKQMSIVGKPGSYAESFANQYRLRFTAIEGPRYKEQRKARRM